MVLKRKRSDSEISTTSSLLSSPPFAANYMSMDTFNSPQSSIQTPSLFSSRTRKRHRDNRPDENIVHQQTLSLLYSSQKGSQSQPQQSQPLSSPFPSQESISALPSTQSSHQSSLHSFWAIPNTRQSSPSSNSSASPTNTPITTNLLTYFQAANCEDCDASLMRTDGDAMDVDMMVDVDMAGDGASHACSECGRMVCHSCAVSNLGAQRKCLLCAGKQKKWVGGIGWC